MDGEEDRNGRNDAGAIIEDEGAQERRSEACEIKGSDVIRSGWTTKSTGMPHATPSKSMARCRGGDARRSISAGTMEGDGDDAEGQSVVRQEGRWVRQGKWRVQLLRCVLIKYSRSEIVD